MSESQKCIGPKYACHLKYAKAIIYSFSLLTKSSPVAERPARRSVSDGMLSVERITQTVNSQPEEHFQQLPLFIPLPA